MVINHLVTSPQMDSYMADEADEVEGSGEGSGVGSVSGQNGWSVGDDENTDEYSGEGSGDNSITTQMPSATDPNGNFRIFFNVPIARCTKMSSWSQCRDFFIVNLTIISNI